MKIAVIGNRGHLNYLFDDLARLPDCRVVAAASTGSERPLRTLAALERLNAPPPELFEDYRVMLDRAAPDIVVAAAPFEDCAAVCRHALERGIAVFTEKPAALTLSRLDELEEAVRKYDGTLYAMMGIRFEAPFHTALQAVRSGRIGAVKLIYTRKSYRLGNRPEYFFSRATFPGTIPWVGIHAVDWIASCRAGAFQSVRALQHCGERSRGTLATAAHCIFALDSGAVASADIDYMRPAGAPTHGDDRMRAVGEKGVIEVARGEVRLIDGEGEQVLELETPPFGCFGQMVRDWDRPDARRAETEQTLNVTRAALAAQRSADENREIVL